MIEQRPHQIEVMRMADGELPQRELEEMYDEKQRSVRQKRKTEIVAEERKGCERANREAAPLHEEHARRDAEDRTTAEAQATPRTEDSVAHATPIQAKSTVAKAKSRSKVSAKMQATSGLTSTPNAKGSIDPPIPLSAQRQDYLTSRPSASSDRQPVPAPMSLITDETCRPIYN